MSARQMTTNSPPPGAWLDRALELLIALVVIVSMVGLGAALAGKFFAPQVLVASLVLAGAYAWKTRQKRYGVDPAPRWRHIALLMVFILFFRLPAYNYVSGGQDEGVYVNAAQHIERTGGVEVHDEVTRRLSDSPYLQQYLLENRSVYPDGINYLPGIYARNFASSRLEFQFYHQLPVWMALFAGLFGTTFGVYALTFFALLSVLFFYRLALLLTRSYHAALAAGGLLALNPLHAFFSKFPVTEVPTLAFSLIGFTLLAAYWSADAGERQHRWLVLSVLAFLCLFTTRISGFMYLPFFVALAMASLIFDEDGPRRVAIQRWTFGVTVAYLVSVVYGLIWSHIYSHAIYVFSFEPLFGTRWKVFVAGIVATGFVLWGLVGVLAGQPQRRRRLAGWLARVIGGLPGVVVFVALLLGLLKIYRLGWTAHYASDPLLGSQWHLAAGGWRAATATSLWTLGVYLGPLLVVAFLILIWRWQSDPRIAFLRWFVAGFFVYALLLQWIIPYAPYYARYLLSELAPYLILLVVCVWAGMRVGTGRAAVSAALFLSALYATALSAAQIGKNEQVGLYKTLAQLVAPIEQNDLILLDASNGGAPDAGELKTPLIYTFDRKVVTVDNAVLNDANYLAALDADYDDLFLITPSANPPTGFIPVDSVRYTVVGFQHTHFAPLHMQAFEDLPLYLYKLGEARAPLNLALPLGIGSEWTRWLVDGWNHPESWGVWSSGYSSRLDIDPAQLPQRSAGAVLHFTARLFVAPGHPCERVEVSVDGSSQAAYRQCLPDDHLQINVPVTAESLDGTRPVSVEFALPDAASPQSLGLGNDGRVIGLGLESVRVTEQAHTAQK